MTPPEPGTQVRVTFTGAAERVYTSGGHPDGHLELMLPVRLEGGQVVYVPLVPGVELTGADPGVVDL